VFDERRYAEGRVMDARVTKSIAEFDRAALACQGADNWCHLK
jgi:hypothetical protein